MSLSDPSDCSFFSSNCLIESSNSLTSSNSLKSKKSILVISNLNPEYSCTIWNYRKTTNTLYALYPRAMVFNKLSFNLRFILNKGYHIPLHEDIKRTKYSWSYDI